LGRRSQIVVIVKPPVRSRVYEPVVREQKALVIRDARIIGRVGVPAITERRQECKLDAQIVGRIEAAHPVRQREDAAGVLQSLNERTNPRRAPRLMLRLQQQAQTRRWKETPVARTSV
jgi:hypothetical protein